MGVGVGGGKGATAPHFSDSYVGGPCHFEKGAPLTMIVITLRGDGLANHNQSHVNSCKGPVNIYGNTGPGNLQRDHRLFWSFS